MGRIEYLLDTHVLLWLFYRKELIPQNILEIIGQKKIFVSSISFWEISIKYNKGKLNLFGKSPEDLKKLSLEDLNFTPLPLDIETATGFYQLEAAHHRDPFDRMLIWQALQHDLKIVTNDANIQKYTDIGLKVLW